MKPKIMIAMSGGVDSSAVALILKNEGFEVGGMTLRLMDTENSKRDVADARSVAEVLGIPFYVSDMQELFRQKVIDDFVNAYCTGYVPNPCVVCNRHIKFSEFMNRARELGYEKMATGHYAKVEFNSRTGRYMLKKADDPKKDQSYMLYGLTQEQLANTVFPLGSYCKRDTRELAEAGGLVNAKKRESQDICFIPDGDYASYIENYTGRVFPDGDFVDCEGRVCGRHKGIIRYTVGQRKGLGIAMGRPVFVYEKDMEKNVVRIGDEDMLFSDTLIADNVNLILYEKLFEPLRVQAKVRYSQNASEAVAEMLPDGRMKVRFDTPQRAITCGQAVVLYDGDLVVGGGRIVEKLY